MTLVEQPSGTPLPSPAGDNAAPAADAGPFELKGLTLPTGVLLALGFVPLLVAFFVNLWAKEHYQFFPLALAGAGFLAWTRLEEVPRPLQAGARFVTAPIIGFSFLFLAAATVLWSPWLGAVSAMIGLAGAVWWVGGWRLLKAMIPAGLLLVLIIPPPFNLDTNLTLELRRLAVRWSSSVLDAIELPHSVTGNVIEIPGQRLLVEEACSGINSVLSTSAVCWFYCLWRRRHPLHLLVCAVMTIGFVLLGNVSRITLGAWLKFHYHLDILSGWRHETVGLILFASYLGLILSLDQLLVFLTEPSRGRGESGGHSSSK
jgi:exosortase